VTEKLMADQSYLDMLESMQGLFMTPAEDQFSRVITDPVAAAKVAIEFAKTTDKFEVVGGAMGAQVLDVNGVKVLAELPSIDALRSKIVGLLVAQATKIAQLANAPAGKLARVFNAYATKDAA